MTSRRRLVALTGALGLLLAARVSTAGPLQVDLKRSSGGPVTQAPPPVIETSAGGGGSTGDGLGGGATASPSWLVTTLEWVLAGMVALVVIAVAVAVVRALLDRLRDRHTEVTPTGGVPRVADAVLADAGAQLAELRTGDATDSVIRCWVRLQTSLHDAGVADDPSRTPAEVVLVALSRYDVDGAAMQRLAMLYRRARFSDHRLGESDREAAAAALGRIHEDLRRLTRPTTVVHGARAGTDVQGAR